jgi:hypothetical protein
MSVVPYLAAGVSNAGGPGMLALTWSPPAGDVARETAALTVLRPDIAARPA